MRRAASPAAAELEAASEPLLKPSKPPKPQLATIYGSVSTTEIAESIRALLAETREGARVVLAAEDVTLLQEEDVEEGSQNQDHGIEGDRLKALGDFRVQVRVKGGEPVFRTVRVIAPEVDPQLEIERSRQRVL